MKLITFDTPFGQCRRWVYSWKESDGINRVPIRHTAYSAIIVNNEDERVRLEFIKELHRKHVCAFGDP